MAMADGYAMASGTLGVVNLHVSCGLGNAMGMLYNAYREGTPLLVTAGQQDRRLKFEEPILGGDMVRVARPWTKWAAEVERVEDLPTAVRRAVQVALTPPTGPVFLSLPIDVQTDAGRARPDAASAARHAGAPAARCAAPSRRSACCGAESGHPGRQPRGRARCRGRTGRRRRAAGRAGHVGAGHTHGRLELSGRSSALRPDACRTGRPKFASGWPTSTCCWSWAWICCGNMSTTSRAGRFRNRSRLVHLDENPCQIGKNYPVEVGVLGDSKTALAELDRLLAAAMTPSRAERARRAARPRTRAGTASRASRCEARSSSQRGARPMTPATLMGSLARDPARQRGGDRRSGDHDQHAVSAAWRRCATRAAISPIAAGRLGWGLGCAMGVKLAWPERPVLALLGDGAALYGIQGLVVGRPLPAAGHVRDLQQRPVSDSQVRCSRAGTAGRRRRDGSWAWIWPSRRSTSSALPDRWAWPPSGLPSLPNWPSAWPQSLARRSAATVRRARSSRRWPVRAARGERRKPRPACLTSWA